MSLVPHCCVTSPNAPFYVLYRSAFDSNSPLQNCVASTDMRSQMSLLSVQENVQYVFVFTIYDAESPASGDCTFFPPGTVVLGTIPTLTSLQPSRGPPSGGTLITISGTGLRQVEYCLVFTLFLILDLALSHV